MILVIFGGIFAVVSLYSENLIDSNVERSFLAFVAFFPAMLLFFIDKNNKSTPQKIKDFIRTQSIIAFVIAIIIAFAEIGFSDNID